MGPKLGQLVEFRKIGFKTVLLPLSFFFVILSLVAIVTSITECEKLLFRCLLGVMGVGDSGREFMLDMDVTLEIGSVGSEGGEEGSEVLKTMMVRSEEVDESLLLLPARLMTILSSQFVSHSLGSSCAESPVRSSRGTGVGALADATDAE